MQHGTLDRFNVLLIGGIVDTWVVSLDDLNLVNRDHPEVTAACFGFGHCLAGWALGNLGAEGDKRLRFIFE
jgi:hypothetical protein